MTLKKVDEIKEREVNKMLHIDHEATTLSDYREAIVRRNQVKSGLIFSADTVCQMKSSHGCMYFGSFHERLSSAELLHVQNILSYKS